jgi:Family of unknown function (DUF5335)
VIPGWTLRETGRELDRAEWAHCFEEINRRVEQGRGIQATLELEGDEVGGTEAERLPLIGITHEDAHDEIAIGLGEHGGLSPAVLWHFVERPRAVWVQDDHDGVPAAIVIRPQDRTRAVLHLDPADGEAG